MFITLKIWPKPTIRAIFWNGNDRIKSKKLQQELAICAPALFDRQSFNKAFHKLKAYYVKEGFFEASLDYNVSLDPLTNEVDITINISEGRAGKIKKIVMVGFSDCEESDLLDQMVTKEYCFFTSWLSDEGTYREEAIQHDQMTILNYLQNQGYADAKVDLKISEAKQKHRIIIYIIADKGERYQFGNVKIKGNEVFSEEEILRHFKFCPRDPYSPEKLRETAQAITDFYGKRGYIDALVDYEPKLSCDQHIYDVNFAIEEGEQFRVGLIKVFGNYSTQTNVILHETFLIPGELFNTEKLQKTEERLRNIGYFENINVYAVKSADGCDLGGNYRDVHIEVEETSTGRFGAFFGFSTVENLFGGLNLTETNFNYKGLARCWKEGLHTLRGGGEYAHITASIGAKSRNYILSWTKPYFYDTPWIVGFDLERSSVRYIAKDYYINATGLNLHAVYENNQFVKTGVHYRLRNTQVHVSGNVAEEEAYDRAHGKHGASLIKESRIDGLISAIGASVSYDSTDHPLRPTRGTKSRLEYEIAGVGGDHNFMGLAYLNTLYYQTDKNGVLRFRGDFRFLFTYGGTKASHIPLDERLFLGGDNVMRGYRPYKLGPRFIEGDPRGGLSMQIFSIEYTRKLVKMFDGFLFLDSGHLSFHQFHFGRLSTSIGYGLKFQIFANGPPLSVGMGYPLNPRNRGEVKRFFLSVGGKF